MIGLTLAVSFFVPALLAWFGFGVFWVILLAFVISFTVCRLSHERESFWEGVTLILFFSLPSWGMVLLYGEYAYVVKNLFFFK